VKTARAKNQKPALLTALTWRGGLHFFQTEYEEAIKLETEAKRLASELRDGFLLLTAWFFLGLAQGNQGRMSDALTTLNDAIVKARRNGDLFWGPRMPNCIGWIHRELQNFPAALKYDQEGCEVGREQHVLEAEANSLINLGIDYTHASETGKTESAFHEVHDIFKRDAWFRWRYNIRLQAATAEHWLAQGDLAKARQFALSLHETALENEAHKYVAVAHTLLGKIAIAKGDLAESEKIAEDNLAEAEKEFATALEEVRRYPAPLVAWKTYAEVGRLQLRMSNAASAREAFAQAAEIINYIANNTRDETLRSTFLKSAAVGEVLSGAANQQSASSN
jgi:tetratricopeptide (TPR) repeat protein